MLSDVCKRFQEATLADQVSIITGVVQATVVVLGIFIALNQLGAATDQLNQERRSAAIALIKSFEETQEEHYLLVKEWLSAEFGAEIQEDMGNSVPRDELQFNFPEEKVRSAIDEFARHLYLMDRDAAIGIADEKIIRDYISTRAARIATRYSHLERPTYYGITEVHIYGLVNEYSTLWDRIEFWIASATGIPLGLDVLIGVTLAAILLIVWGLYSLVRLMKSLRLVRRPPSE